MMSALEYLTEKHRELLNDFKSGKDTQCNENVKEMAETLLDEGKSPYIIFFVGRVYRGDSYRFKGLKPLQYNNRVEWTGHLVCCEGDYAYDPLIGKPVLSAEYSMIAFGDDYFWHLLVSSKNIKDYTYQEISSFNSFT